MKLSIIIPVYNSERYLDECISSLYNQGLDNDDFEILLIDDESTDSSRIIVNKWIKQYQNISLQCQSNQGQAVARNAGLDIARGKYIMFVDSDDYILPQKLQHLLDLIEKNSLEAIIYNFREQTRNGNTFITKISGIKYNHVYTGEEVVLNYFIFGSMCKGIFLREIFEINNLRFKSGFTHEDSELCFRLYPLLKQILFLDEDVYFYRYNEHSTDRSKSIERLIKNIESDAVLVSKIIQDIELSNYSTIVKNRYRAIANSIMIGFFRRVKINHIWNNAEFERKIIMLKELRVYPIIGITNSLKSYIVSKILNIKYCLKFYLYRW